MDPMLIITGQINAALDALIGHDSSGVIISKAHTVNRSRRIPCDLQSLPSPTNIVRNARPELACMQRANYFAG